MGIESTIDELLEIGKKNREARDKLIKRLEFPVRKPNEKLSRYQKRLDNFISFQQGLVNVLLLVSRSHKKAIDAARNRLKHGLINHLGEYECKMSVMKLSVLMDGGPRIEEINREEGKFRIIENDERYRNDVKILLDIFFIRKTRGSTFKGLSTWTPREVPLLSDAAIEALLFIRDNNVAAFKIILTYMYSSKDKLVKKLEYNVNLFDLQMNVDFEKVKEIRKSICEFAMGE